MGADDLTARLLREGSAALASHGASAALEAQLLLAHALGRPRSQLLASDLEPVPDAAAERFRALLRRCAAGEPLAYLTGEREFWSLPLAISPAVLVPRPETELVVERALALLDPLAALQVADLGTGSGAIALAVARERPAWSLLATDLSAAALGVARANARHLGLANIAFLQGRWCAPLAAGRYSAILSNPPYIAEGDPALPALAYEPALALTPGPTGLEALRAVIDGAAVALQSAGVLVLEHGADQADAVAGALVARGYARVRCHRDLAGHERVTEAQWPGRADQG